jgi:phosphoglycolate phosphatase-like HAD superfamily hydrolase
MKLQAVLFDLIGTTVRENDPNIIMNCFEKAFLDNQIGFDRDLIRANRGRDKLEMIDLVIRKERLPPDFTTKVYNSFKVNFASNINNFSPNAGTLEMVTFLRYHKIKIGLGTGLPRDLFEKVVEYLNWSSDMFDYIGIGNEAGKPRPHPDMIYDMMRKLSLSNKAGFLKVGDTVADVEEGKNAGVMTAALLAGTQSREDLKKANPDFILEALMDLKKVIAG